MRWNNTVGSDEYADYADVEIGTVETLMRAYVALLDKDGSERVKSTLLQLNQQIQLMGQEIFDMDYSRFYKDVATMGAIYERLRNNPQFPQKDLFKTLSIDGCKAIYMLNWAERLGRISRIRHKGTWLLSITL